MPGHALAPWATPYLAAAIGRTRLLRLRHAPEPIAREVPARTGPLDPAFLRDKGVPVPDRLAPAFRG